MISGAAPLEQIKRNERTWIMIIVLGVFMCVPISRLVWLQLVKGKEHLATSEANRLREDFIQAPRGLLLDREGRALVQNRPSRNFVLDPALVRGHEKELFARLKELRDIDNSPLFDTSFIRKVILQARISPSQRPVLLEDASPEEIALFAEQQYRLPGLIQQITMRREYPFGTLAGHVLGYIGQIPENRVDSMQSRGYRMGSLIGQMGLEQQYEDSLRGRDGVRYIEVNARGRVVGVPKDMPHREPIAGKHIRTTIDLDLQKVAEASLPDSISGAVVVLDPQTGEILAMASSPRIDPNIFSLPARRRAKEWARLALDSRRPLNNRAIQGLYEPASTFKAVTSMAGLLSGRITDRSTFPAACHGGFRFGARYQRCWDANGHGHTNMYSAMAQSCDVYYYQLGLMIDMPIINRAASELGLGSRTEVDLPNEKSGILIDSAIHEKRNKRLGWKWARGLILNLAIGQGQLITPIQLATMYGGIGNGRRVMKPHFMKAIYDPDNFHNAVITSPSVLHELDFRSEHIAQMHAALDSVVQGSQGTGRSAQIKGVRVAGKTGSAENPHGDKTHALFGCFAPSATPEIAIGVILENAGHGGSMAAPIAGKILKAYFQKTGRIPKDTISMVKS